MSGRESQRGCARREGANATHRAVISSRAQYTLSPQSLFSSHPHRSLRVLGQIDETARDGRHSAVAPRARWRTMSCSSSSARAATARARVTPPATRRRLASRATRVPSRRHARAEPGARNPYAPSAARRVLARALDGDDPADAPARDLPESITDRPPADRPPYAAFDVDDALSAWILLRYVFLWVVFGYVAAPAWAQARGVRVPADLDPVELALVLAAAEVGKLAAVALMLRSELGPDSPAVPWARERRGADPPAVARGLAFGILASVAARASTPRSSWSRVRIPPMAHPPTRSSPRFAPRRRRWRLRRRWSRRRLRSSSSAGFSSRRRRDASRRRSP